MNTEKRKTAISAAVVVVLIGAGTWYAFTHHAPSAGGAAAGGTVATVNGTAITQSQLAAVESQFTTQQGAAATTTEAKLKLQSAALDALIGQELLKQAAEKAGFTASSTAIDTQLASDKAQFKSQASYEKALAAQGMTEADLRTQIGRSIIVKAYLEKQLNLSAATATPAEIKTAYDQVASTQKGVPPLSQVRDQVAQMVVQQKQQAMMEAYVTKLRAAADVQILISTSTPAV